MQEKASEILGVICEGFSEERSKKHSDKLEPQVEVEAESSLTPSPPEQPQSRFKSDHIVSRMRLFFQGGAKEPRAHSPTPQRR